MATNAATPASETDHCASERASPVPEDEPMVITPPVALVPMLMVWVLAAVPMLIVPLLEPEVPTLIPILPAVLLVEFPVAMVSAPVFEVDAPVELPVVKVTPAEFVPSAV